MHVFTLDWVNLALACFIAPYRLVKFYISNKLIKGKASLWDRSELTLIYYILSANYLRPLLSILSLPSFLPSFVSLSFTSLSHTILDFIPDWYLHALSAAHCSVFALYIMTMLHLPTTSRVVEDAVRSPPTTSPLGCRSPAPSMCSKLLPTQWLLMGCSLSPLLLYFWPKDSRGSVRLQEHSPTNHLRASAEGPRFENDPRKAIKPSAWCGDFSTSQHAVHVWE